MKIYLVGGAVRDELLGNPVQERDWVVVGSTPEEMLTQGFQAVGKDFPVFLHPETHEEYALARTERKVAKGYQGFQFHAAPAITLEEDLKRRDLTINAIAKDERGELIDPFHGQADLKEKIFRHVSPAFAEDPVRILRLARFAAKLPDFTVIDTTNQLMQTMANNGEVDALVAERVWKEWSRALNERSPQRFFEVLNTCGAFDKLFTGINFDLEHINSKNLDGNQRFATSTHLLSSENIKKLCKQYRIPTEYRDLAILTAELKDPYTNLNDAESVLTFLKRCDALRREARFTTLLDVLKIITDSDQSKILQACLTAMREIDTQPLQAQGLKGQAFAEALQQMQLQAIQSITSNT